jgi:hypothetical protein
MFDVRTSRIARAALPVVALAITAAFATPAAAQHLNASVRTPAVDKVIPTMLDARRLVDEGRWRDARDAYDAIIGDLRVTGSYAKDALRELANLQYLMDNAHGAANTWEELGGMAETFGDPATELDARFKAALLFQEAHDKRAVALQVARIRQLLKSPVIPDEAKAQVERQIRNY